MAEAEHLKILKQGVAVWNQWRKQHPEIQPNLRKADLRGLDLHEANFNDGNLRRSELMNANLTGATFRRTDLRRADLSGAILRNADLTSAILIETNLERAVLTDCLVYGISAWNVRLDGADQRNLVVSKKTAPTLRVDNIEVAQFVYLLINNSKIRDVISTVAQKAVLLLGRFSPPERKEVLESIAQQLRTMGFLPIIFDFEGSAERDFTETIKILAGLSLFVIADITNPKSAPLELQATVPDYKIPFVVILKSGEQAFSMFQNLTLYDWVLRPIITYSTTQSILQVLEAAVIKPALEKHRELQGRKAEVLGMRSADDIMKEIKRSTDADR